MKRIQLFKAIRDEEGDIFIIIGMDGIESEIAFPMEAEFWNMISEECRLSDEQLKTYSKEDISIIDGLIPVIRKGLGQRMTEEEIQEFEEDLDK